MEFLDARVMFGGKTAIFKRVRAAGTKGVEVSVSGMPGKTEAYPMEVSEDHAYLYAKNVAVLVYGGRKMRGSETVLADCAGSEVKAILSLMQQVAGV